MKCLLSLPIALCIAAPVWAQDSAGTLLLKAEVDTRITVVATGTDQRIDKSGQSVSVIARDEIVSVQGPDLTRVLERAPGVTFTRNGGPGGFTGVRVRGADAEQLLVLIDGVRVADVASPGGGFDFGNLLTGSVERIDLLRGSNSVVWGSQAIGGVMAITSRQLEGVEASAEYGARDSVYANATAGGSAGAFSGTLSGGFYDTDGFSAATVGSEPDGFRQWQISGRARADLTSGFALTASGRHADGRLDIDGFAPPSFTIGDTPEYQDTRETSGRVGATYAGSRLSLNAGLALAQVRRDLFDPGIGPDSYFTTKGRNLRADLIGRYDFGASMALDFGADHEWSRFSSSFDPRHRAQIGSAHGLLGYYGDRLTLAAGARIDDHSRFGSEVTLGANASFSLSDQWRVRGSFGEGFKAPTLFQLLSDFGNTGLQPERSRSVDLGMERGDRNGPLHLAATLFRRDSRDLIDFIACPAGASGICTNRPFGTYDNVARARAEGVEVEMTTRITANFRASAVYAYTRSHNRATLRDLARRPRHAATVSLDWTTPLAGLTLGGDLRMVSDSFDDPGNFTPLDGYALATLRASAPVGDAFELFARLENVTDQTYETAAGYGSAGRSGFVGARARF